MKYFSVHRFTLVPPFLVIALLGVAVLLGVAQHASAANKQHGSEHAGIIRCPKALRPGGRAPEGVLTAVRRAVPRLYPAGSARGYQIVQLTAFAGAAGSIQQKIAVSQCGKTVATRSWFAFLTFPQLRHSASSYAEAFYR